MLARPYLVISDLQIPFEATHSLSLAKYVKKHYGIPDENVLCVGDEIDANHGGMYQKDPNGIYSPVSELNASRVKLKEWYSAFPLMKVAISNHGLRWARKAAAAEIPSQMLKSYQDIIQAPEGWQWKYEWRFAEKYPFRMIHGMGYSGINGHRNAAVDAGMSTLIGHLHSSAGIAYIRTGGIDGMSGMKIWGFNVGSLIDVDAYAFAYGKECRQKPCLGLGVVFNGGSTPLFIPYE